MGVDVFLRCFNAFLEWLKVEIDVSGFDVNFAIMDEAFEFIRMGLWFLPVGDILAIVGLNIILKFFVLDLRLFGHVSRVVLRSGGK